MNTSDTTPKPDTGKRLGDGLKQYWRWLVCILAIITSIEVGLCLWWKPDWILPLLKGIGLGALDIASIWLTLPRQQSHPAAWMVGMSVLRMMGFGFLIVLAGYPYLEDIGLVFCGFFSYKLSLMLALVIGHCRASSSLPPYKR